MLSRPVVSDWWAQHTGVASTLAGLDVTMAGDQGLASGNTYWGSNLTAAVLNGTIPQWRLDDMVVRLMSAYYKVGRDKARVPVNFNSWNSTFPTYGYAHPQGPEDYTQINWHVNVQDDHAKLIREIGGASTVLLKNSKITSSGKPALPLNRPKSIAIIGDDAHDNPTGPNGCPDRGCSTQLGNTGTLAMGWGSGTANFPYLIAPVTALKAQASQDHTTVTNVSNNYDLVAIKKAVVGAQTAIVFANADSGERYITVDGNGGDRNNLTLWGNGDALVEYVASLNPNTILVVHSVGPVILEAHKKNPNITAILWAGLPGQETGNAITDVLYGVVNPQAKSVFTWGKSREDYGVDVQYTFPTDPPQLNFKEGTFIDYRHFDAASIEPTYEFGFGLSYTTFSYSNLQIVKLNPGPYQTTKGKTSPAPTFGKIDFNPAHAQFPPGFHKVPLYVYPYLNGSIPTGNTQNWPKGATDSSPQPLVGAGGSSGGNRQLWDVVYKVSVTIKNTGGRRGTEIAQLVRPSSSLPPIFLYPPLSPLVPVLTELTTTVPLPRRPHRPHPRPPRLPRRPALGRRLTHRHLRAHAPRHLELGYREPELGRQSVSEEGICRGELERFEAGVCPAVGRSLVGTVVDLYYRRGCWKGKREKGVDVIRLFVW